MHMEPPPTDSPAWRIRASTPGGAPLPSKPPLSRAITADKVNSQATQALEGSESNIEKIFRWERPGVNNCGPRTKTSPTPPYANTLSLNQGHIHSFTYRWWGLSSHSGRVERSSKRKCINNCNIHLAFCINCLLTSSVYNDLEGHSNAF